MLRRLLVALIVVATVAFVVGTTIERNSGETSSEKPAVAAKTVSRPVTSLPGQALGVHHTRTGATVVPTVPQRSASRLPETAAARASETPAKRASETTRAAPSTAASPRAPRRDAATAPRFQTGGHAETAAPRATAPHTETPGQVETVGHTEAASRVEARIVGVNIEGVPFVILAALVSLGLAAAVWRRPRLLALLLAVIAVMLMSIAVDVREIAHQAGEHRTGLVAVAGLVGLLHLAAATTAAVIRSRG